MSLLESETHQDERALAPLLRRLEAERERWFFWVPVLLGVGIGLYFWLSHEPSLMAALAPFAIAIAVKAVAPRSVLMTLVTGALLTVTFGFALAKLRVEWVRAPVLSRQITTDLRGFVERVEPRAKRGQRITRRVSALGDVRRQPRPRRVRFTTNRPVSGLKPGDAIHLRATLMPPSAPALPGGFDFARHAWFDGLGAVGYARSTLKPDMEAGSSPPDLQLWAAVERVRQAIGQRIMAVLPGQPGAIANALITGERGGISEETNAAFRASGLFHVLSISGLHMVIMSGSVFFLVRLCLAAVPALALRYPIKKWAAVAATVAAFAYLLISGASFATVRSVIMISIMFLAVVLDRPALALRNVVLAALVILILFPESLFNTGFQMSFAAVAGLVAFYEAIRHSGEGAFVPRGPLTRLALFLVGIVLSTLVASAAVAPFAAYHFHQSQQYAVLANLIAIPLCNLIVMPAALATLMAMPFGLETLPLWIMGLGIEGMTWVASRVGSLPGAVGRIPAMPTFAFLLMVAGGLWLVLWQTRWRLLGAALVAAGIALAPTLQRPDVLIARDGALVAVRSDDQQLSAVGSRRPSFELIRWLEHDGDTREPKEATKASGFKCDAVGCRALVKGVTVAVARHPAALADDCQRVKILIASFANPRGCNGPAVLIDFFAVRRGGTHAVYIEEDGHIRVETVAQMRGDRPWSSRRTTRFSKKRASKPQ